MEKPVLMENARSGRSKCVSCKKPIAKDSVRVAAYTFGGDDGDRMARWLHLDCWTVPSSVKSPDDVNVLHLSEEDQKKVKAFIQTYTGSVVKSRKSTDDAEDSSPKKPKAEASSSADKEPEPEPKKQLSDAEVKKRKAEENKVHLETGKISPFTVEQLKNELKKNDQTTTGIKSVLISRIADGRIRGRIPRCPKCKGGRLRFNDDVDDYQYSYSCPGYRDDDEMINCNYKCDYDECTRLPWTQ